MDGGGTADAITATYSPALTALVDGQLCFVRATLANATTTPTFNPSGLGAGTIVKGGGTALVPGDIRADGHELVLRYNLANTRWELLNVAPGDVAEFIPNVVADGSTDNHAVIQASIDAAIANGGGRVLLPAGTIKVTEALVHYGSAPVTIVGAGPRATVLSATTAFDAVIKLEGDAYGTANIVGSAVTSVTVAYPGRYASAPTVTIYGDGSSDPTASCTIDADGRIDSVTVNADGSSDHTEAYVAFGNSTIPSLAFQLENLSITTTAATSAVLVGKDAWQWRLNNCVFSTTAAANLVDTYGIFGNIGDCVFSPAHASAVGLYIRGRMIDSHIHHTRFGNIGKAVRIATGYRSTLVASSDRPQGITFTDCHLLCTGAWNLYAGESLFIKFVGCWFTEATTNQILIDDSADHYTFSNCYIGGVAGIVNVDIKRDAGNRFEFLGCEFNFGTNGITVRADADEQIDCLIVIGCLFQNITTSCLQMDSVNHAIITGNIDRGTPSSGSWITLSNHSTNKGEYQLDNNAWHTTAPVTFATAANYIYGDDTGIVGRARGLHTVSPAATSDTITHGLFRAPEAALVSPIAAAVGDWFLSTPGATTVQVNWATSGVPKWAWEAWA